MFNIKIKFKYIKLIGGAGGNAISYKTYLIGLINKTFIFI